MCPSPLGSASAAARAGPERRGERSAQRPQGEFERYTHKVPRQAFGRAPGVRARTHPNDVQHDKPPLSWRESSVALGEEHVEHAVQPNHLSRDGATAAGEA